VLHAEGSGGKDMTFRVVAGNQNATSFDCLTFTVLQAVVTRVSGCEDDGPRTVNCSTAGRQVLTLHGSGFSLFSTVTVGSAKCEVTEFFNASCLQCLLPPGAGQRRRASAAACLTQLCSQVNPCT
jgi:hypothetical protein